MDIPSIKDHNFYNKSVLLRVDFNIPMKNGEFCDFTRIYRVIPTINYLVKSNAKVIIISHFGRPKNKDDSLSLRNIVGILCNFLDKKVKFIDDCIGPKVKIAINKMKTGDIILLENLRFYKEEEKNDYNFAMQLASLADVYVNDAFSSSHRAHASILDITKFLPSYAGICLKDELDNLEKAISFNSKPITVIVGGSKISTKIKMLIKLTEKVDCIFIGGAIANNFFLFNKINIGKSYFQNGVNDFIYAFIKKANENNCEIVIPQDVLVAKKSNYCVSVLRNIDSILDDDIILDIGPKTLIKIRNILENSNSLFWNGPIGVFEYSSFVNGTIEVMKIVSYLTNKSKLNSIIGGGDSLSAINIAGFTDKDFTYVSTGGGAFLSWLSGDIMPGIHALQKKI